MTAVQRALLKGQIRALPEYLFVFALVACSAWINNKPIEAGCFLISFFSLRYKFDTTFHADTTLGCMLITNGIFLFCIPILFSIHTTLFANIAFGFIICYVACIAGDLKRRKKQELKQMIQTDLFDLSACADEQLRKRCRERRVNSRDTEIAVKYFIEHKPPREILEFLESENEFIEISTLYKIIDRLKKKLS